MKKLTVLVFMIMLVSAVFAQDAAQTETGSLEDELFGGDTEALVTPEQANAETQKNGVSLTGDLKTATLALESNKLRIGGSLNAELGLKYVWADPYTKKNDVKKAFLNPEVAQLRPTIGANLFFDARPVQDLKLYGKFIFEFPFEKNLNGKISVPKSLVPPNGVDIPVSVNGSPNFKIWELYTDFSTKDIAFFRFGKHTVKWGTGYFYSPADVINISRIDPQKPTEDREGRVSLRTHIVIPKTQYNIWLYLLPDTETFKPQYTAGAAKAEFVFGDWELGVGGWYRYEKAPRFITTLSGSIAGKVAVFAEGVFAWGSDYTYYRDDDALTPYTVKNKPFFQATLGGSYSNADSHTMLAFQYYYNGFGYTNSRAADRIADSAADALNNKNFTDPSLKKYENIAAMGNRGQHYIAFTISQNKIGTEDLTANLFQQFAISELEGLTTLSLNWKIFKFVQMSTGSIFSYPLSPASHSKGSIGYNLSFKLGGGKF
ncbi:hypothetical protein GWP43_00530 [Treponema vincentii]|uniref:Uncharacterized protein n=1 Tax=Treponema vincentii TaxID=69710 RepID=A0A6P1XYM2_9SPIR|nr:hypothetical protein [Treponema vincentii]QHX42189.1 hypothetical protein GWP43_00530 [Treponema vincentii]